MAKRAKKPRAKAPKAKKPKTKPVKATRKPVKVKSKQKAKAKRKRPIVRIIVLKRFAKKKKKPPVRYRRPTPRGMVKLHVQLKDNKLRTGNLFEFKYGYKQVYPQVGGWKNDPRPVILLFYDDEIKYIEGVNTNYLSEWYIKKIRQIMTRFPGVDGVKLYDIFKRTAKFAITKGYRKYIRSSFRDIYLYVYQDELLRELDELAKREGKKPRAKAKKPKTKPVKAAKKPRAKAKQKARAKKPR